MPKNLVYFTSLALENVRAFGDRQTLLLTSDETTSAPARWTLIIGENGVGKTTLLQCLAKMRPIAQDPKKKIRLKPAIADAENDEFEALARSASDVKLNLEATFSIGKRLDHEGPSGKKHSFFTNLDVNLKGGTLKEMKSSGSVFADFTEPLIIAYGASRHMGHVNSSRMNFTDSVASLFDPTLELVDAEEILQQLDYAQSKNVPGAKKRLTQLTAALLSILPHKDNPLSIEIHPRTPVFKGEKGVFVRTPSGSTPFLDLSLGYQTVTAWTIDMALRLFDRYPDSENPLSEPAIVLVDEIDLHLHPRWQREIREELTKHFPNVQFIVTAHSPLMVQTYLDANIAVIRLVHRQGHPPDDHQAVIVNDPVVVKDWRLDQIMTSELFGLGARSPEVENKLRRQVQLEEKTRKTPHEKRELSQLNRELESLPTSESHENNEAMELIRRAAQALK